MSDAYRSMSDVFPESGEPGLYVSWSKGSSVFSLEENECLSAAVSIRGSLNMCLPLSLPSGNLSLPHNFFIKATGMNEVFVNRVIIKIRYLLCLPILLQCGYVAAEDWPNWMGPNFNGVSNETGWSSKWPADGLSGIWAKEIGIGFSSISVSDGLLYSMGHRDGQETVWCLNAATGVEVWSHSYPAELNPNLYEGGPGATPTVYADAIYTLSIDGRLLSLDRRSGEVRWEKKLTHELGVDMPEWGFDSSPLILGDQVIVQGGRVVSFARRTGEKLWQTEKHNAGYGAVRAFSHNGESLLASLDCDGLRISKATDGAAVVFQPWKSPFQTNSTTPIVAGNSIYVSTGYNVGCGLFLLDGSDLKSVYTNKHMRNHFNSSILVDGYLYGMDGNSNLGRVVTLTCMKFDTGEVMWKERGLGCGSLIVADGKLLVLSEQGVLVVAEARADAFHEIARSEILSGRCWTAPVLANGKVYARNAAGNLVCVQLPSLE